MLIHVFRVSEVTPCPFCEQEHIRLAAEQEKRLLMLKQKKMRTFEISAKKKQTHTFI